MRGGGPVIRDKISEKSPNNNDGEQHSRIPMSVGYESYVISINDVIY